MSRGGGVWGLPVIDNFPVQRRKTINNSSKRSMPMKTGQLRIMRLFIEMAVPTLTQIKTNEVIRK